MASVVAVVHEGKFISYTIYLFPSQFRCLLQCVHFFCCSLRIYFSFFRWTLLIFFLLFTFYRIFYVCMHAFSVLSFLSFCCFPCFLVCLHPKTMFIRKTHTRTVEWKHASKIMSNRFCFLSFYAPLNHRWHFDKRVLVVVLCPYGRFVPLLFAHHMCFNFWPIRQKYGWRHLKNGFVRKSIKTLWWNMYTRTRARMI